MLLSSSLSFLACSVEQKKFVYVERQQKKKVNNSTKQNTKRERSKLRLVMSRNMFDYRKTIYGTVVDVIVKKNHCHIHTHTPTFPHRNLFWFNLYFLLKTNIPLDAGRFLLSCYITGGPKVFRQNVSSFFDRLRRLAEILKPSSRIRIFCSFRIT